MKRIDRNRHHNVFAELKKKVYKYLYIAPKGIAL